MDLANFLSHAHSSEVRSGPYVKLAGSDRKNNVGEPATKDESLSPACSDFDSERLLVIRIHPFLYLKKQYSGNHSVSRYT